ncbi:glycoside hydrolase/deacetylase [Podospora appendiculata]|uniref:Glycoside hydrolase/deacetylase n=1 Tax=Podospora appendiculata TaxID=314037 RepID=A0AAE0X701_9PEZI|nr:glycoside hydrolase/deacetylase [Podospora appendiculata]
MLLDRRLVTGLAGLLAAAKVSAVCTSNLMIDNFVKWTTGTNNLDWQNGDDGSMTAIAASNGQVVFIPSNTNQSYFYESFPCQQAQSNGYGGLRFTIQGPAGASTGLELQTTANCNVTSGRNSSYTIISGLTGQLQTVTLPLSGFDGTPNYDSIIGLAWSEFSVSDTQWSIGNITLVCGDVSGSLPPVSVTTGVTTLPIPTTATTTAKPTSTRLTTIVTSTAKPSPTACASNLLIDDWESQSRLTFLGYNAMNQASSDDGTMASIVVSSHRVMLTPANTNSYFYSQFGCLDATTKYGGISFRIRAARGTTFAVTMGWYETCGAAATKTFTLTSTQLKWTFDGTERLYWFPFSVFTGIDASKLNLIYFSNFNAAVILGPMSFYCGTTATEYVVPAAPAISANVPRSTSPAPVSDAKSFVIDNFASQDINALGQWHGGDDGMTVTYGNKMITVSTNDSDLSWNTQLASGCADMRNYTNAYLHIAYSGSNKFSVAMQQHNALCDENIKPYPETWDSLEVARYASATDIYMPISHFHINLTRAIGFNLRGFYTTNPTYISKIEVVDSIPAGWTMPSKLPSGNLIFSCTRPNSFAFAIDDGDPTLAKRVMQIVKEANIPVTFFTVGLPLLDTSTNLSKIYKDMAAQGHQIALHSYTHPKMEGLPDTASIDWEYTNDIGAVRQVFGAASATGHTNYFRPPFGTEGARMRQRLAVALKDNNPYIVGWSVDVEDWIWAESATPEKQLDAFKRDLAAGGNLVVMHYLYNTTVEYLPQFIKLAKATGKQLMRVDQCMQDPKAPPLPK